MDLPSPSVISSAAAATSSAMSSMSMAENCKISMLWNWYTIDSCFISRSWHITSNGMFAGSCIGVILLVMSLEFLRRLSKEYDGYILRQHQGSCVYSPANTQQPVGGDGSSKEVPMQNTSEVERYALPTSTFRPSIIQQTMRATLHMVQFAVAYFVMLLAMYYNGYFIICIIIGAWLGAFVFSWESVTMRGSREDVTVCCG